MSFLTPAKQNAALIDAINSEVISYVSAQARRAYALANTPGEEANIMAELSINAVAALTVYAAAHGFLVAVGADSGVAAPDFTRFTPQPDGSVVYVAPPEPEPEPEP